MGIVALVGDCTTTTALAMAATWPRASDVLVVEFDPSGGSLTGWLDTPMTPSLSTLAAARPGRRPELPDIGDIGDGDTGIGNTDIGDVRHTATPPDRPVGLRRVDVDELVRTAAGVRFIAAPVRAREAARSIHEVEAALVPFLASDPSTTVLVDAGRRRPDVPVPAVVSAASVIVIVHRQDPSSAGAASVRLERVVETVESVASTRAEIVLAVIGERPFDVDDIGDYVASASSARIRHTAPIAVDALSAMSFAGRNGVSPRRLARLPLCRSAALLVDHVAAVTTTGPTGRGHPDDARPGGESVTAIAGRP